jgi:hypothetical protein
LSSPFRHMAHDVGWRRGLAKYFITRSREATCSADL